MKQERIEELVAEQYGEVITAAKYLPKWDAEYGVMFNIKDLQWSNPQLIRNTADLLDDAVLNAARVQLLANALRQIAAYSDTVAEKRLAVTGSYSAFDEPGAVQTARAALAEAGLNEQKEG